MSLKIGDSVTDYVVGERWGTTQDQLVTAVRPLWDGLSSGVSQEFQLVRSSPFELDPSPNTKAEVKYGKEVAITSVQTWSSPRWRFFRNRDGISGIEQMEDGGPLAMISGESVNWPILEEYLRNHLLEAERVGLVDGEQAAPRNH